MAEESGFISFLRCRLSNLSEPIAIFSNNSMAYELRILQRNSCYVILLKFKKKQ